jgi:hypothetical protein
MTWITQTSVTRLKAFCWPRGLGDFDLTLRPEGVVPSFEQSPHPNTLVKQADRQLIVASRFVIDTRSGGTAIERAASMFPAELTAW